MFGSIFLFHFIHLSLIGSLIIFCNKNGIHVKKAGNIGKIDSKGIHGSDIPENKKFGILASSIAHDLNNLFTVISLNLSSLKSSELSGSAYGRNLKNADHAVNVARRIAKRLFYLDGSFKPDKEEINIKELLEPIFRFAVSGSSANCSFIIDGNIKNVYADRCQLEQVFHNLILNAVEATIVKGKFGFIKMGLINKTVNKGEARDLGLLKGGEYVLFTIKDNGSGISSKVKEKVFDPYFTTKKDGNGLGLSTCKEVIENHGGCIGVESADGEGCTFFVYLTPDMDN